MIVDARKNRLMTEIIQSLTAHFSKTGRELVSMGQGLSGMEGLAARVSGNRQPEDRTVSEL